MPSLRSSPLSGPSSLLRTAPPLCCASVLSPLPGAPTWTSPFASQRQVPEFLTKACAVVTPPSCRTPDSPKTGSVCPRPGSSIPPVSASSRGFDTSSVVHLRSSQLHISDEVRLRLFLNAHHADS